MKSLVVRKLYCRLSQQIAPVKKGGDYYAIGEQAIEILFFKFYIFLFSTDQNSGGLSIIYQSAPEDKVGL